MARRHRQLTMTDRPENPVQVERLKARLARTEQERDQAYEALRAAGDSARRRRDVTGRWAADVQAMAAVLMKVAAREDVPDDLRQAAAEAVAGGEDDE